MSRRVWILLLSVSLSLACSGEAGPKAAGASQGQATTAQGQAPRPAPASPAPPARDPSCGPEVEGQADNVRSAVLDALIRQSLQKAAAAGTPHGEIIIGEEQRMPNGQVFVHDASPGVTAHFANHTPPVGGYSSGFSMNGGHTDRKKGLVAFTTGEICWKSGGEAVVKARTIGDDSHTAWSATLQRTGADWLVKSIDARR
ncbi:MAG TPA: hypothetical protein VFC25_18330 [Verrucomicrobiae bacterium]|nr:hypothetical protein [Verrucomicrobiae bacterium]